MAATAMADRDRDFFHRHGYKHELIIITFFIAVFIGYYKLITLLGIEVNF
jgi:hypothetical protein